MYHDRYMRAAFFIRGKMPSLNELLDDRGSMVATKFGKRVMVGGDAKKTCMAKVVLVARMADFFAPQAGFWSYLCVEENRKRDPSNIFAGAIKVIEDALVMAKLAPGDGWKGVLGISSHLALDDDNAGVLVVWDSTSVLSRDELLSTLESLKG